MSDELVPLFALAKPRTPYSLPATVVQWHDGDTLRAECKLGLGVTRVEMIRLDGVNTPELASRDPVERAAAQAALLFASGLAPAGSSVRVNIPDEDYREKYGRLLAKITLPDGNDVATLLITTGHGKPYHGEAR